MTIRRELLGRGLFGPGLFAGALVWAALLVTGPRAGATSAVASPPLAADASPALAPAAPPIMSMVLTKTIFGFRVLSVGVNADAAAEAQLRATNGLPYSDWSSDRIAATVRAAKSSRVTIRFLRDVAFDRFFSAVSSSLECAARSRLISKDEYDGLVANIPKWFEPVRARGLFEGDTLVYDIASARMHTVYRTSGGQVLIDHVDVGDLGQRSVLGSYFAPCSEFREPLVRSLLR